MCEKITLAGVLEIHVEPEHVKVYTVYRNDTQRRTYGEDRMECKTSRDFFCEYNSEIGMEIRYYLQGYKGTLITDGYQISSQL